MKNRLVFLTIILCSTFLFEGCGAKKEVAGNYSYRTECLGSEMDGSVTVKAWGNGRNRSDAIEQARKNAVYDVIFKGITEGVGGCNFRPVVGEVNARQKYEGYFDTFFRDKGPFQKFVTTQDEQSSARFRREHSESRHGSTYGVVLRIKRADIREKLINDGIINQ